MKHEITGLLAQVPTASNRVKFRALRKQARHQAGQTIVVALLTLVLLAFVGTLFITIVSHNLQNASRAQKTTTVDQYAEAGLRFADQQLTDSPDGADWRPPTLANSGANANDPDAMLLNAGFSRYNFGRGRFLIRITYNPLSEATSGTVGPTSAIARYIKIESIGRDGNIDPNDPTTFKHGPLPAFNQTLVAYKAIGLTDFARFETNPENRADVMNIGVPGINTQASITNIVTPGVTDFSPSASGNTPQLQQFGIVETLGAPNAYLNVNGSLVPNPNAGSAITPANAVAGGGSFFANGTVRFYGTNNFYLSRPAASAPNFDESVQVAGDLLLDGYNQALATASTPPGAQSEPGPQAAALELSATGSSPVYVRPSNFNVATATFDTFSGAVRDGAVGANINDAEGNPRAVNRIEPPTMDAVDPASKLSRYQLLATTSLPRLLPGSTSATYPQNASASGFGQVIYVNNFSDIQQESSVITGGATIMDEWLHRTQNGWLADYYNPPGVDVDFNVQTNGSTLSPGVTLTRSDTDSQGDPNKWIDPTGATSPSHTMRVEFSQLALSNPNHDVIIYAEGNVRLHGIVSATGNGGTPWHVTVVTDGTAYIEGSLLKGNPDSSIAVLAHDYVCVNTTQFFAGKNLDSSIDPSSGQPISAPGVASGNPDLHALSFDPNDSTQELLQQFTFGIPLGKNVFGGANGYYSAPPMLYVSAGADGTDAASASFQFWDKNNNVIVGSPLTQVYTPTVQSAGTVTHTTISLPNFFDTYAAGDAITFGVRTNASSPNLSSQRSNLLLERAAVLPGDVRIEAVLFSQTKSFFVIPGPWFNSDKSDDLFDYYQTDTGTLGVATAHNLLTHSTSDIFSQRFPFYGQPPDLKITIYGTVCEARPAPISAQGEWMRHWGWIPIYHGALAPGTGNPTEAAGHSATDPTSNSPIPAPSLQIIYDPEAGYPVDTGNNVYLRTTPNGSALPFAPKLPVCAGLLYQGQTSDRSLFQ